MMQAGLDGLWESLPIPAVILDENDRILTINPMAEGFFNNSSKSLVGAPIWDRLMVDAPIEGKLQGVRATQSTLFVNDVDVGTGDRAPVVCNLQFAPYQGREGAIVLLISPRELAGRVNQSSSVSVAARSAIGMAEMLAHEIKNPLAGITGAAQLLSMALSPEDQELTDLIVEETRRIVKLLEQVEQFGNLRPPVQEKINIHDILTRVVSSAKLGFGAHMAFHELYDPSLPEALGDADQLTQVIMNLVKNASEASRTGGNITLRTYFEHSFRLRRSDGTGHGLPLQIEVMDDGPGLPDDIRDNVFEPFVSGRENGTGLGLALASKIILDHRGWIGVESVPGRTVFRISLPIYRSMNEERVL